MADIIQIRRDLAEQWVEVNPILASGELGLETDSVVDIDSVPKLKVGNAVTHWNDLPYIGGGGTGATYKAPLWTTMTPGSTTFTHASLIGATEMNYIIINKVMELIDEDYEFDNTIGQITRVNQWQVGDKLITPHKHV